MLLCVEYIDILYFTFRHNAAALEREVDDLMKAAYFKKHLINLLFTAAFVPGTAMTAMAAQVYQNTSEVREEAVADCTQEEQPIMETPNIAMALSNQVNAIVGNSKGEAPQGAASVPGQLLKLPGLRPLGVFKTTGYCPCRSCSAGWGRSTSTGAVAVSNHTIAVDPSVIPYGTKVMINGIIYTAEDKGGGVRGRHIDIFFDTHSESRIQGVQYAEVFLLEP